MQLSLSYSRSKRKRRQASNGVAGTLINNNLINFTAEIAFDGVVLEVNEPLMVFENPVAAQFVPLVQDYMANSEQSIAIQVCLKCIVIIFELISNWRKPLYC